jgi:hypothetical protein
LDVGSASKTSAVKHKKEDKTLHTVGTPYVKGAATDHNFSLNHFRKASKKNK